MDTILDKIKNNFIDYDEIIKTSVVDILYPIGEYDINVVVPVRNRLGFLAPLLKSLSRADKAGLSIEVTVVEHDRVSRHRHTALMHGVNYIFIQAEGAFNKCEAFNVGVIVAPKSKYIVLHDLDCMVQKNFFLGILENMKAKKTEAVQSYYNRSPVYCDHILTPDIICGNIDVNELHIGSPHTFVGSGKAPGGSITITRELFFRIGGFDAELFTGYAPEDQFFWDKMAFYTRVGECDEPMVNVFHLCHELTLNTNPKLKDMIKVTGRFEELDRDMQECIIEYKRNLLVKYA